jgi:pyrroline-5-carboxylate reductase
MSSRLTKKQRKGIAFRERKNSKREPLESSLDVKDVVDGDDAVSDDDVAVLAAAPKRKRSPPPITHEQGRAKKRKLEKEVLVDAETSLATKDEGAQSSHQGTRYILFLGGR